MWSRLWEGLALREWSEEKVVSESDEYGGRGSGALTGEWGSERRADADVVTSTASTRVPSGASYAKFDGSRINAASGDGDAAGVLVALHCAQPVVPGSPCQAPGGCWKQGALSGHTEEVSYRSRHSPCVRICALPPLFLSKSGLGFVGVL